VSKFHLIWCLIDQESKFQGFCSSKTGGSGFESFSVKTGVFGFPNRIVRFCHISMTSDHYFGRNFSTVSPIDLILLLLAS
jgi:hypothetical protein